ncbi:MAG: dihydroorotate dehydrogenase electron transfer subunit [Candidatus Altiarchaeota archaeon]
MTSGIPHDERRLMNPVHVPRMLTVEEVVNEAADVKTFFFREKIDAKPGQFVMLWLPRVNEKPFSLSYIGRRCAVTVARVGPFTKQAFKLKKGGRIGVRGPYGTHYTVPGGKALVVCGGFGTASVAPLVDKLAGTAEKIFVVVGAKTKGKLFFINRFKAAGAQVCVTTDDGSEGIKCLATDNLPELHKQEKFDVIYSCGPEPMMKKVMDFALKEKIDCQLSLERYMKCGMGVCGSCSLGKLMVCRDGPVFSANDLAGTEFGIKTRDACGRVKRI